MKIIWIYNVLVDKETHITTWKEMFENMNNNRNIYFIFPYENTPTGFTDNIFYIRHKTKVPYLRRIKYLFNSFTTFINVSKKVDPDIVILDEWSFFFSLAYIFRSKPKILLDVRTPAYNYLSDKNTIKESMTLLWSKLALTYNRKYHDGITLISEALRQKLTKDLHITLHQNYMIWPSGVNAKLFSGIQNSEIHIRTHLNLFFHGELSENRGLAEIIEAVKILKKQNINIKFYLAGDGPYKKYLEDKVYQNNLSDHISFLGRIKYECIPAIIESMDICMMTYPKIEYWEGNVPLKILEYFSMGKVVICTDLIVFKVLVKKQRCAIFMSDNQPKQIAEAVTFAVENRNKLNLWGSEGIPISKQYSWPDIAQKFEQFLQSLIVKSSN